MTRRSGGTKRSSWLTFRRRLLLVRLLLRSTATKDELLAAVQDELGEEGYPPAAEIALKHDVEALKKEYGCIIKFRKYSGYYSLENTGNLALLDLPDECMEALTFLDASFPPEDELPEHAHIRALLERIWMLMPRGRREQRYEKNPFMSIRQLGRTTEQIDPKVLQKVKRAIQVRQELEFDYISNFDDQPRRHRVAPYNIFFRAEGHGYLDATLLDVKPKGRETIYAAIDYRLNRIVSSSIRILPNVLPHERIPPPTYALRYELLPIVARRRDVASYFPNTNIAYHDDGSATVTATITNIWQARQILLRYGSACHVIEPPELVEMFQATAQEMAQLYLDRSATQTDEQPAQSTTQTKAKGKRQKNSKQQKEQPQATQETTQETTTKARRQRKKPTAQKEESNDDTSQT